MGEVCVGVLPSVILGVLPSEFPPVSVRPSMDAFVRESSLPTVMFQSWLRPYEIDSSALPTSAYSRDGNIYEQRQYTPRSLRPVVSSVGSTPPGADPEGIERIC